MGLSWTRGASLLVIAVLAGMPVSGVLCARLCATVAGHHREVDTGTMGCHDDEPGGPRDTVAPASHDLCGTHASVGANAATLAAVRANTAPIALPHLAMAPVWSLRRPLAWPASAKSPPGWTLSAQGRLTLRI